VSKLPEPTVEFRPVPLWSWNYYLNADVCGEWMREFAAAGFGGAYLHARLGMPMSYVGSEYRAAVADSVAAAAGQGIHAHLYDEDRWPSGWAGGVVPIADERFRLKALRRRRVDDPPSANERAIATIAGYTYCVATMPLGHPKFNGTCYTDLTDPDAMRCFIDAAYEPLRELLGERLGGEVPTVFSDEPALTYLYTWPEGGLPWSERLADRYRQAAGQELHDSLPALFDELSESPRVRVLYYRTLVELMGDSFMRQIAEWCGKHRIRWTGHFMYEHSLPLHFSWSCNCHSLYRHFDWPGVDHLGRQVGEVVTAIGCRSAVHQFGKERMMTELYGASGQHLSFADRKWIAEQQLVLGANHFVPHLTATTLVGARKRDYPPTISPHQPWWPLNRMVEDHVARLAELMAAGTAVTDLLVIHPQESMYVSTLGLVPVGAADTWVGRFFHPAMEPETAKLDKEWKQLCHELLDAGYVIDFGDEAILAASARVEQEGAGAVFRVADATYRAVVVPSLATIRPTTLELISKFANAGGIVVQLGDPPRMVDGRQDADAQTQLQTLAAQLSFRADSADLLVAELLARTPPEFRVNSLDAHRGRIWRYTKQHADTRLTLVANLDRLRTRRFFLGLRQPYSSETTIWHTTADRSELVESQDRIELILPPGASCIICEGELPRLVPAQRPKSLGHRTIGFESLSWQVSRLDVNALVVDHAEFSLADGAWDGPYPVLAIKEWLDEMKYAGLVRLRYVFHAKVESHASISLRALVEEIESAADLRLNGRKFPIKQNEQAWRDRHWRPVELPKESLQQCNALELTLANFQPGDPGHAVAAHRLGTTLESLIVLGDFSVDGVVAEGPQGWHGQIEHHTDTPLSEWLPRQPMTYLAGPFVLRAPRPLKCGDVCTQGLPFYTGRIRYDTILRQSTPAAGPTVLRLEELNSPAAAVEVNGRSVGCFAWAPLEVDLAPALMEGDNRVSVTLYHSLRNLLGPHHHPDGEPVYVNPGSFRPEGCTEWLSALRRAERLENWSDWYALVEFGLCGNTN
jgi:hypothetical protein